MNSLTRKRYILVWTVLFTLYMSATMGLFFSGVLTGNNLFGVTFFMFASMLMLLSTGLSVAFSLCAVAIASTLLFQPPLINILLYQFKSFTLESGKTLVAIPLFILMGLILHYSGIARDLFTTVHLWSGRLRGGLGMGTVAVCAILAAMIGVSSAATISMGIIAVPAMLAHKYNKHLAVGIVQAGGALGFLIPPSIMMIMYAFIAQESVGRLFAAGIVPGILLACLYVIYIGVISFIKPEMAPSVATEERVGLKDKIIALKYLVLPVTIVLLVLGSIFTGVASPTEGAAVGVIGAYVSALFRGSFTLDKVRECLMKTLSLTSFNAYIIIGAMAFSGVYSALGASALLRETILGLDVDPIVIILLMQLSFFILGMFLDDIAILFLSMPIYIPIIEGLQMSPIWFAVLFVMNMQMAYITPPYGLNLFYMKSVVPKDIDMMDLYKAALPFLVIQAVALLIVLFFPSLTLWLPGLIFDYFQMKAHPEMLFANLHNLMSYPSLIQVLINHQDLFFQQSNFVNVFTDARVAGYLLENADFAGFLLESPRFDMELAKNSWLADLPELSGFMDAHPERFADLLRDIR